MKIKLQIGDIIKIRCDLLAVNLFEGIAKPGGATGAVDKALSGAISREINGTKFEGKEGEMLVVPTAGKIPAKKVLVVGLGKQEDFSLEAARRVAGFVIKRARAEKTKQIATIVHGAGIAGFDPKEAAQALVEGSLLASYQFLKYKNKEEVKKLEQSTIKELIIAERDKAKQRLIQTGVKLGELFVQATNYSRDLVNEPSEHMVPKRLADEARQLAKTRGISVRIYNAVRMRKMKMGGVLGVGQGSDDPPYFVHLMYKPAKRKARSANRSERIFLVGKGITFDTGGISLKPAEAMETMKMDMAGAAAVLGVFSVIDKVKPKAEVHGVFAACENMPSGKSIKPGDVLRAMNRKTMEITNTDAEGRVVLADALSYAVKQKASAIVDLATLTGACIVALGDDIAGMFSNDEQLKSGLLGAARTSGEKIWELPLEKTYKEHIKSRIADIKNVGKPRSAGAIAGALFLQEFVGTTPWAHLDIAGPAWQESDAHPYIPTGGTGFGVRTLLHYLIESGIKN